MYRLIVCALSLVLMTVTATAEVTYTYLTWQNDTSTTITVNWQATEKPKKPVVYYSDTPFGDDTKNAMSVEAEAHRIDSRNDIRWALHAELTGLTPAQPYYFSVQDKANGSSPEYKFKTITDGDGPVRFATGGDMEFTELTRVLLEQCAATSPDFVAIGGDIAYANGNPRLIRNWDHWFRMWMDNSTTPDGFMIPLVLAIGNHETFGMFNQTPEKAPYFFGFFKQAPTSYFALRFGPRFAMIMLDTSHVTHHKDQVDWLRSTLEEHADVPYTFALYHVPLYPSVRLETGEFETRGRDHWGPVFDEYGLTAAFENHDHALKRTKLLTAGEEDPNGVLYLGDGCFGQDPRELVNNPRPYMEKASSTGHFWYVEVGADGVSYKAIDRSGAVADEATTPAH